MNEIKTIEGDFGFFSSQCFGEVLSIRFKENLLEHLTNLNKRNAFEEYAKQVSEIGKLKVVILQSELEKCGCEEYAKFFLKQKYQWDKTICKIVCTFGPCIFGSAGQSPKFVIIRIFWLRYRSSKYYLYGFLPLALPKKFLKICM